MELFDVKQFYIELNKFKNGKVPHKLDASASSLMVLMKNLIKIQGADRTYENVIRTILVHGTTMGKNSYFELENRLKLDSRAKTPEMEFIESLFKLLFTIPLNFNFLKDIFKEENDLQECNIQGALICNYQKKLKLNYIPALTVKEISAEKELKLWATVEHPDNKMDDLNKSVSKSITAKFNKPFTIRTVSDLIKLESSVSIRFNDVDKSIMSFAKESKKKLLEEIESKLGYSAETLKSILFSV